MRKKISTVKMICFLLTPLVSAFLLYLFGAFISLNINPIDWEEGSRAAYVLTTIIVSVVGIMAVKESME